LKLTSFYVQFFALKAFRREIIWGDASDLKLMLGWAEIAYCPISHGSFGNDE